MLRFLRARTDDGAVEALHAAVVAGARRPGLFAGLGVPDTPWGRAEAVMLHALLAVRRLRRMEPPAEELAQALVDRMFADFDRALREIGVGDMGLPRKMKGLGGDWLGRVRAYAGPLDARDAAGLAAAIARNVLSRPDEPDAARGLAAHALACEDALAGLPPDAVRAGALVWPAIDPTLAP